MALILSPEDKMDIHSLFLPVGKTIRMNHGGCTAGTDTRRRLYVTHDAGGHLLCYCHNCAQGTALPMHGPRVRHASVAAHSATPSIIPPPPTMTMPILGNLFMRAWGLEKGTEYWHEDGGAQGILFPCHGGYQIRWLKGNTLKWQTFGDPEYHVHGAYVMICEDLLSARKWLEADMANGAMCLFGAKASKVEPPPGAEPIYLVWLDNDQPAIDELAKEISNKLGITRTKNVVLVKGGTDPKRYTRKELLDVRDAARKLCGTAPPTDQPYHVLEVPIPNQRVRAGLGVKRNPS